MIQKNFEEFEYLSWTHKTKWLKAKMKEMTHNFRPSTEKQLYMPLDKLDRVPTGQVSVNALIASKQQRKGIRA